MSESVSLLSPGFNRSLRVEARRECLSSDSGVMFLRDVLDKTGVVEALSRDITDPRRASHVVHDLEDMVRTGLLLVGQGWTRESDADLLRHDPAFCLAASGKRGVAAKDQALPSQATLSRLVGVLAEPAHRRVLGETLAATAGSRFRTTRQGRRQRRLTLDVDGLPISVAGHQAGSAWNGYYRERVYHPLIASCAETGDMVGAVLRPGNAGSATDAGDFIETVVDRAERHLCQVALVRMDAGFPGDELLSRLERNGTPYVARLRANPALDRLAAPYMKRPRGRRPAEPREWYHDLTHAADAWSRARRVILVVKERPDDLLLDRFFLVTSIGTEAMNAEAVLDLYRQRGMAEGHMGEVMDVLEPALSSTTRTKTRYAGRSLTPLPTDTDPFGRNEALLLLHLLAYEALHTVRRGVEAVTGTGWSLKRLRREVLTAAGRLIQGGRRLTLVIEAHHAALWARLWHRIQTWAWTPAPP